MMVLTTGAPASTVPVSSAPVSTVAAATVAPTVAPGQEVGLTGDRFALLIILGALVLFALAFLVVQAM